MALRKRSIQEIPLRGTRVFMRVDFNVPLDAQGRVSLGKAAALGVTLRLPNESANAWMRC